MQIDLSRVENVEDLRSVPAGEYPCSIAEVRETRSAAGHLRWGLRWEVDHGEWQGRTACWDSLHFSERGMPRAKFVLQVLGFPVGGTLDLEPQQLVGRRAMVLVQPEEREDPVSGIRRLSNRVPFTGYAALPQAGEAAA